MKHPVKIMGFAALLVVLSLCLPIAQARDETFYMPIENVLEMGKALGKLDDDIKFYFSGQPYPAVEAELVQDAVTNKKTSLIAFRKEGGNTNKTPEEACKWAMLSALISFQQRARKEGGNAIINIESYYKKKSYKSKDQYECHAGSIMFGVALKGDVVRLSK